jgi:hypothetical protein
MRDMIGKIGRMAAVINMQEVNAAVFNANGLVATAASCLSKS